MALTEVQKVAIRVYTGRAGHESQDTRMEGVFRLIDDTPGLQEQVENALASIALIERRIIDLLDIVDVEKAEESKLRESREKVLRTNGRREVQRLASMIGVDVVRDIFGAGGMAFVLPMG